VTIKPVPDFPSLTFPAEDNRVADHESNFQFAWKSEAHLVLYPKEEPPSPSAKQVIPSPTHPTWALFSVEIATIGFKLKQADGDCVLFQQLVASCEIAIKASDDL